jgi:hypothetical protein
MVTILNLQMAALKSYFHLKMLKNLIPLQYLTLREGYQPYPEILDYKLSRGLYYKTFYGHNLRIFP